MAGLAWTWPTRAGGWRNPAIVAASVLAHALVLGLIGMRSLALDDIAAFDAPPPVIMVEIEPRPLLSGELARVRPQPAARPTPMDSLDLPGSATAAPALPFRAPRDEDAPSAPAPRFGPAGVAPPAEVGAAVWQLRPRTLGDRVARGLRVSPVGCANPRLLTAGERAVCDERFGLAAARAAPIDDTDDSPFAREGARALANYESRRRPLAGGSGNVGPSDGVGSNFGMGVAGGHLDPSFQPDSTQNIRTNRRDGPR
ncbi:hypothetical protein [Brevundimonas sp.]|uniref:hypothetical protein n=1 Tax=Brevundimonas sp. TaxID=1871086 RepID=UPI0035643981